MDDSITEDNCGVGYGINNGWWLGTANSINTKRIGTGTDAQKVLGPNWRMFIPKEPSKFPLVADTQRLLDVNKWTFQQPQCEFAYPCNNGTTNPCIIAVVTRHMSRCNVLALDGHVDSHNRDELIKENGFMEYGVHPHHQRQNTSFSLDKRRRLPVRKSRSKYRLYHSPAGISGF